MANIVHPYIGSGDFFPGYSTAGLTADEYQNAPAAVQALYGPAVTPDEATPTEPPADPAV